MAGKDFKGCKAFIRSQKREGILTNTTINEYEPMKQNISANVSSSDIMENDKVSVLIIHKDTVLEFKGTVKRKDSTGNCEIGLFQGREKEDREAERYPVNIPAKIVSIIIGSQILKVDADAEVINLSTSGILIRSPRNILNVGTKFQVVLEIAGNPSVLNGMIVRIHDTEEDFIDYGCELIGRK